MAPTPERARRLSQKKIEALLTKYRIRRVTPEKVVELLRSPAFCVAPGTVEAASRHALILVRQAQLFFEQRRDTEKEIHTLLQKMAEEESEGGNSREHSDVEIILSVPGCGNHFVATVLAEASQALAERNYKALRASAGVAPVTKQSGKSHVVTLRYACNKRLRRLLHLAAGSHATADPKARALYAAHRARGQNHARAVRAVGDRLLKLIITLLEQDAIYDPTRRQTLPEQSTASIAA
jgi:transposase